MRLRALAAVLALALTALVLPPPARAADVPTFGTDYLRDRTLDTGDNYGQIYADVPVDVQVAGVQSYSTPVEYGGYLYQYAYQDTGTKGYLFAYDVAQSPPTKAWAYAMAFDGSTHEEVAGVAAPSVSPDGKYMAMGVGQYLYTWPIGVPGSNGQVTGEQWYVIKGNRNQQPNQVDSSPAVTPPLPAQGINTSGASEQWTSPYACVGSWNGGVTCMPLEEPSDIAFVTSVSQYTTSDQYPGAYAIITSSPTVLPNGDVAFGVDGSDASGTYHPRVVVMNPTTGTYRSIGDGVIRYGISSSVVLGPNGNLYVPDRYGDIYEFTQSGSLVAENTSLGDGRMDISDIAVAGQYVFAVVAGYQDLYALNASNLKVAALLDTASVVDRAGIIGLVSPSVVYAGGVYQVWVNDAAGYVMNAAFQNPATPYWINETVGATNPSYAAVMVDGGPQHVVAVWSNALTTGGSGGLEIWYPQPYALTAQVQPNPAAPATPETLTARTPGHGTTSSVVADVPGIGEVQLSRVPEPTGASGGPLPIVVDGQAYEPGVWSATFNAPDQGTYTIPVTATDIFSQTYTADASLTVVSNTPPPPAQEGGGELTLQAYALPGMRYPHPPFTAKLGDQIYATLTVPEPTLPAGDQITGAYLVSATVTHPTGNSGPAPNYAFWISSVQQGMVPSGLTAQANFLENWSGYPPPQPPQTMTWQGTISAQYTMRIDYRHSRLVQSCTVLADGTKSCTSKTEWFSAETTQSGTAAATLTITGTDWYVIVTPAGGTP